MQQYLRPSETIDYEHPRVQEFVSKTIEGLQSDIDKAKALYLRVRDYVLYDPYVASFDPEVFKASYTLKTRRNYCIPKAVLLAAVARAAGIPARLGFADVKNHLASEKLLEILRTDVFAFHGYTELYLSNKWVKATPAFNRHLCKVFRVKPLEFDGLNDSVFHEFSTDGHKHMQYLHDHGHFAEVPFQLLDETMRKFYPHWFEKEMPATLSELGGEDEVYTENREAS